MQKPTKTNASSNHRPPIRSYGGFVVALWASLSIASAAVYAQNTLVIVADDLGTDQLRLYREMVLPEGGAAVADTPTIDRLAEEGVLFNGAWANPVCSSTRVTLQTGVYSLLTNVRALPLGDDPDGLEESDWTISEMLDAAADAGQIPAYAKAAIGKWHMNYETMPLDFFEPIDLGGFDYFEGTIGVIGDYCDFDWTLSTEDSPTVRTRRSETHATDVTTDRALRWLNQEATEPWFLYVSYHAPHSPYHFFEDGVCVPCEEGAERECAVAMTEHLDSAVGRLMAGILESEHEYPTIVFLGDNGSPAYVIDTEVFPFNHGKNSVFEGGLRVPWIVSGTQVPLASQGRSTDALVNSTDLLATLAEFSGVEDFALLAPEGYENRLLDTISLVPLLAEEPGVECAKKGCRTQVLGEIEGGSGFGESDGLGYRSDACPGFKLVRGCLDCEANPAACDRWDCPDEDCLFDLVHDTREVLPLTDLEVCPDPETGESILKIQLDLLLARLDAETDEFEIVDGCPRATP